MKYGLPALFLNNLVYIPVYLYYISIYFYDISILKVFFHRYGCFVTARYADEFTFVCHKMPSKQKFPIHISIFRSY